MGWFDFMHKKVYQNTLKEMFEGDFNVMFIPSFSIFHNADRIQFTYPYANANSYTCNKQDYVYQGFDTAYFKKCLTKNLCVIVEVETLGSLIFTNHEHSDLFYILQREYRKYINYVFEGNATGGYFKILQNGKIKRKIASCLVMEGIKNYPETRGEPCEYEIEHQHIYKIDHKAKLMKDLLKEFKAKEVLELFDYYVGFDALVNDNIKQVEIYDLVKINA